MATPFSEDGEAKPDPAILVEEAGSDLDVQGDTLEDAIDLDGKSSEVCDFGHG